MCFPRMFPLVAMVGLRKAHFSTKFHRFAIWLLKIINNKNLMVKLYTSIGVRISMHENIDKDVEGTRRVVRNNPSKLWTKHPNSTKTCPCPSLRIHLCKPNASDTISMFSAVGEHGTKKRVCAWPGVFTVTQRTNFGFSRLQQQNDKLKKMLQKNNQKLTQNFQEIMIKWKKKMSFFQKVNKHMSLGSGARLVDQP